MVNRFRQESPDRVPRTQRFGYRSNEIVTLASLVERETPKPEERPLVAGVFTNRLRNHVPLQCDPTVVYALQLAGQYTGSLERRNPCHSIPLTTRIGTRGSPGAHRQPWRCIAASGARAATDRLPLFCRQYGGRSFLQQDARRTRSQRSGVPPPSGRRAQFQ